MNGSREYGTVQFSVEYPKTKAKVISLQPITEEADRASVEPITNSKQAHAADTKRGNTRAGEPRMVFCTIYRDNFEE